MTPDSSLRASLRAKLATRTRLSAEPGAGTPSAVLIPLFERDGDVSVWLLRRADGMRKHAGQIAFPGGKHEERDPSLVSTALREAEEEIGLAAADIEILGALDDYVTITGYTITPYVGWLTRPVAPWPNSGEVARVFSAPLRTFLATPQSLFPRRGYRVEGELVWGATAAIATALGDIVRRL
jgi:8-oxo-dGTP pyrophosphatase MutT (NUDIX family)